MTSTGEEIGPVEAAAAIGRVESSREWLANRVIAPGWYHPALGVLAGALIAIGETRNWALFYWGVGGYSVACGALMWVNQRRAGVWIGSRRGKAGLLFAGEVAALILLVGLACWLDLGRGLRGTLLVAAAMAVLLEVGFGRWIDAAIRTQLRAAR